MKRKTQQISILLIALIMGACTTTKNTTSSNGNQTITEKHWKLIELNGKEIIAGNGSMKEPHILLQKQDSRAIGNGNCNSFNGEYALGEGNKLSFKPMAATMMACPDMATESEMFKMFAQVDSYSVSKDGKFLFLNKSGQKEALAKFEEK